MSRACTVAGAVALCLLVRAAAGQPEEPFPPKGDYRNSVHRFFPDLDARLNAVRYGRWRGLEIAWISGIDAQSDREFLSYFLRLAGKPPRFDPEASRVAPRLTREAATLFRALRWGQVLEAQSLDILASPDSTPSLGASRMARLLTIYRREPSALTSITPEEPAAVSPAIEAAPASARVLIAGTRLFALAAEDLAASDFGQQRWRVKKTLDAYDFAPSAEVAPEASTYRVAAPAVQSRFPETAEQLDRVAQFRRELFGALVASPQGPEARRDREVRLRELALRWGLPAKGIGGR